MQLKPLSEILAMSAKEIDATLAPIRAAQMQAKANLEIAKLREKLVNTERQVLEAVTATEIDFTRVLTLTEDYDLLARRITKFNDLVGQLWPSNPPAPAAA